MENELKTRLDNLVIENCALEEENKELKNKIYAYESMIDELFERLHKMERLEERYKAL